MTFHEACIRSVIEFGRQHGVIANFKRSFKLMRLKLATKEVLRRGREQYEAVAFSGLRRDFRPGIGSGRKFPASIQLFIRLSRIAKEIRKIGFRDAECRRISRILLESEISKKNCAAMQYIPECPVDPVHWGAYSEAWWMEQVDHLPPRVKKWVLFLNWNIHRSLAEQDAIDILTACEEDPGFSIGVYLTFSLQSWKRGKNGLEFGGFHHFQWLREHPEFWPILEANIQANQGKVSVVHITPYLAEELCKEGV